MVNPNVEDLFMLCIRQVRLSRRLTHCPKGGAQRRSRAVHPDQGRFIPIKARFIPIKARRYSDLSPVNRNKTASRSVLDPRRTGIQVARFQRQQRGWQCAKSRAQRETRMSSAVFDFRPGRPEATAGLGIFTADAEAVAPGVVFTRVAAQQLLFCSELRVGQPSACCARKLLGGRLNRRGIGA